MIKAAIIGGAGYVGGEILRLLLFHPDVKIVGVTAKSHAGEKVSKVHQNLTNICNLSFLEEDLGSLSAKSDVLFLALPHGVSMAKIHKVNLNKIKIIDLGADFRLSDYKLFEEAYGINHLAKDILKEAVYGLPEVNHQKICRAHLVSCPGCFPTGSLLALYPLAQAGLLTGHVVVDSATGSSGSGIKPQEATHHPQRADDFRAYSVFTHRHTREIKQQLCGFAKRDVDLVFTAHSAPMVRGIFTTAYAFLEKPVVLKEINKLYANAYKGKPFIRLVDNPRVAVVAGTNYCDIGIYVLDNKVIITSAIDNLVKGAAGQAVQNMNIMFGIPETKGLEFPGLHP